MEDYTQLTIVAELAFAVAGFAGVFAVLRHEASGDWTRLEQVRMASLLGLSIPVAFFSLVPAGLAPLFERADLVWQISAACSGATILIFAAWSFPAYTRVTNAIPALANRRSTTVVARGLFLLLVIAVALYGSIVFDITAHKFSCYYFALLVQLAMCSILFTRILLVRPPANSNQAQHEQG